MNCPACERTMREMEIAGVTVDVCDGGCGGVWFDNYELDKVDEQHEAAGQALLEVRRDPDVTVDHEARRDCPRCDGIVMQRHFRSHKREIQVDTCPGCGGVWLDLGELGSIRSQFKNEDERNKAGEKYINEAFGAELEAMKGDREARRERSEKVARAFRFICPSYWLPGKQEWGAF